eukprot:CAMPEP_0117449262 /NCGR_PEP_ID=MMETSP0759-20121206/7853_1 /TAXON_ID=63605 /ORGANISM="Percolomonas cosmopolitus, Strain WS" /LENGTH=1154 /DNA_ID=CAMNT_0005241729 /DNA_START=123 /DNA_END=3587 /DNA_ORIENTATION=-
MYCNSTSWIPFSKKSFFSFLLSFIFGILSMYLYLHFTNHHLITRRMRHTQFLSRYEGFLRREGVNVGMRIGTGGPREDEEAYYKAKREELLKSSPLGANAQRQKYDLVHARHVKDLDLSVYEFRHVRSGLSVIWVHEDDPHLEVDHKFLSIAFRTPPLDHTGLTHILEHLSLCGSESYPIRDPFFSMIKRSLQTYMNAWTISDHTQYVFSTQNEEDFWNLMRVYLDSAFKPLLRKLDFHQEAYRVGEHGFEGVVYNEMQGSLSNPTYFIAMAVNWIMYAYERNPFHRRFIPLKDRYINATHNLYNSNFAKYRWNSGGDPRVMTMLQYDDLVRYHETFYHPSNALVFIHGGNLARSLKMIDKYANVDYKKPDIEQFVKNMSRSQSKLTPHEEAELLYNIREKQDDYHIYVSCPPDVSTQNKNKQTKLIIAFQTNQASNVFESFALTLIAEILFHNPRGPLYKSLIRSGLAQDFFFSGYEAGELLRKHTLFTIGVTGVAESDVRHIEEVIFDTLYNVTRDGVPREHVEAILNQMELGWKEVSSDFGHRIALRVVPAWINNASPHMSLRVTYWIRRMRAKISSGANYLESKVRNHFIDNRYRETIVLTPDPTFGSRLRQHEKDKFDEFMKSITPEQLSQLKCNELNTHQSRDSYDISILPTLSDKDIRQEIQYNVSAHLQKVSLDGVPAYFNLDHTNGIVYLNLKATLDLDELMVKEEMVTLLPLLTHIITKIGTRSTHFLQLSEEIDLYTGGISSGTNIISDIGHHKLKELAVSMSSMALFGHQEKQIDLMGRIFFNTTFGNHEYLKSLLLEQAHQAQESILQQGHNYAAAIAGSTLIEVGQLHEMFHGWQFVQQMSKLFEKYNIEELLLHLKNAYAYIHHPLHFQLYVTCEPAHQADVEHMLKKILVPHLKDNLYVPEVKVRQQFVPRSAKTYVALPISVHYVSRVLLIVPSSHPDYAHLIITANLMQIYLHGEIREKGGAYGAFAEVLESGVFVMKTYRDPHVIRSFEAFDFSINQVCEGKFNRVDLREAKLKTFQRIDRPMTPHQKGMAHFLNEDIDDNYRQKLRIGMLNTTTEDIIRVCNKYLKEEIMIQSLAVIGPSDTIPEEIKSNDEWKIIGGSETTNDTLEDIEEEEKIVDAEEKEIPQEIHITNQQV